MMTKKDNNAIKTQSSSPKKIYLTPNKIDQLQQLTEKSNVAKSSFKIGETPDVD